jgi:ferredoxin
MGAQVGIGTVAFRDATSLLEGLRCARSNREDVMSFRVVVDFDKCESNALCMGVAPEVFEVRDDDFLYILQDEPPDELRAKCEEAARICPKQAITISDS